MIAALLVTIITGALVGVYLKTVTQEVQNAYRARMAFQAVNLAEAGLEYAMDAMVRDDWSSWQSAGSGYYRDNFSDLYTNNGSNELILVKVFAEPNATPYPVATAEGIITLGNGISVAKQIRVELTQGASNDPTRGGFWGNGILGKYSLNFGGQKQTVDSFHSGPDVNTNGYTDVFDIYNDQLSPTTDVFGHRFARDNGSVASNEFDIALGNADIFGKLSTKANDPSDVTSVIGPNGSIYNSDTLSTEGSGEQVDLDQVAVDFYQNLPDVNEPDLGDTPQTEYSNQVIGSSESPEPTKYQLGSIGVKNNETLTIEGEVVLYVTGDINVKGSIVLAEGAKVDLYVGGNMDVGGGGLVNTGLPENFRIFSTQTEDQAATDGATEFKLHGTAPMSAAVYAPNTDISLKGGGESGAFYGALVGGNVLFAGNNYDFHYDEALGEIPENDDPNNNSFIPEVFNWTELTDASQKVDMSVIESGGS